MRERAITVDEIEANPVLGDSGWRTAKRHLTNAVEAISGQLDAIEYQRSEVRDGRKDSRAPGEGQLPGYNNVVRINYPETLGKILSGLDEVKVGRFKAYTQPREDFPERKNALHSRVDSLRHRDIPSEEALDEKEALLHDMLEVVEDLVDLIEDVDAHSPV